MAIFNSWLIPFPCLAKSKHFFFNHATPSLTSLIYPQTSSPRLDSYPLIRKVTLVPSTTLVHICSPAVMALNKSEQILRPYWNIWETIGSRWENELTKFINWIETLLLVGYIPWNKPAKSLAWEGFDCIDTYPHLTYPDKYVDAGKSLRNHWEIWYTITSSLSVFGFSYFTKLEKNQSFEELPQANSHHSSEAAMVAMWGHLQIYPELSH